MRRTPILLALALAAACRGEPAPAPPPAAPSGPAALSGPAASSPPQQPPHPTYGGLPDWGEPDMPKIEKLFRSRFPEVKRCYEAELQKSPDARGKLTLRFTIVESGALRYVSVAKTTFPKRSAVPACVAEVVRRWKTPFHPAEPVEVEYPFSFSPR